MNNIIELKARVYDLMAAKQQIELEIQQVNQEILKKTKEEKEKQEKEK